MLYEKLEQQILPMFYDQRDRWIDVMRHAIVIKIKSEPIIIHLNIIYEK